MIKWWEVFIILAFWVVGVMLVVELQHSANCDSEMRTSVLGVEYVCMRVPEEGLAQDNEELKRMYKL